MRVRVRVRFMVWVRGKCTGGIVQVEMSDTPFQGHQPSFGASRLHDVSIVRLHRMHSVYKMRPIAAD